MPKYRIALEHLAEVDVLVGVISLGLTGGGCNRAILPVIGGSVKGERLKGRVCPIGGDWALIRTDNCLELDVRALIETDDGASISTSYTGIIDMTKEQVEQFAAGQPISPSPNAFTAPRFETGNEKYKWLNRIQAVGRGSAKLEDKGIRVHFSWYTLTAAGS